MSTWFRCLAWIYVALLVVFLFFPVLIIAPISFSADRFMRFPPEAFGLRWYATFFKDPVWVDAALRSLRVAFLASILSSSVGTALVVWMRNARPTLASLVSGMALSPAIIPNIVISLGVFLVAVYLGFNDTEIALEFLFGVGVW